MQPYVLRTTLSERIAVGVAAFGRRLCVAVDVRKILASAECVVAERLQACRKLDLRKHRAVAEALAADISQRLGQFQVGKTGATHELHCAQRVDAQLQVERRHEHIAHERRHTVGVVESAYGVFYAFVSNCGWNGDCSGVHVAAWECHLGEVAVAGIYRLVVDAIVCEALRQSGQVVGEALEHAPLAALLESTGKTLLHVNRHLARVGKSVESVSRHADG